MAQLDPHACRACRRKKIQCDRVLPSCSSCRKRDLDCAYTTAKTRYSVSRERSCTQCRARRMRCDRGDPCTGCGKGGYQCVYKTARSMRDPAAEDATSSMLDENANIEDQTSRTDNRDDLPETNYHLTLLGSTAETINLKAIYPTITEIWVLWHKYTENIDPLFKIFHAPSVHKQLLNAVHDLDTIEPELETILFAIFYAVTVSQWREDEISASIKEARLQSLERYRYGFEQCLHRGDFLSKPSFASLQSLVLFIATARHSPLSAPTESLLALAISSAFRLELHQEKTEMPQPPYHFPTLAQKTRAELRRRLWWQLLALDVQIAEDNSTDPKIWEGMWTIRTPSNLDDVELDATSDLPLPPRPGESFDPDTYALLNTQHHTRPLDAPYDRRTDMTFALLHIDMCNVQRRFAFSESFCQNNGYEYLASPGEKIQFIESFVRVIDRKYLQFCNRNDIFSFFERNAAKLMLSRHLMIAKKGGSAARDNLHNSLQVLEASTAIRRTHQRWAWLLRSFVELDAMVLLLESLDQIARSTEHEDVRYREVDQNQQWLYAWLRSEKSYERGKEHGLDRCYRDKWARVEVLYRRAVESQRAEASV